MPSISFRVAAWRHLLLIIPWLAPALVGTAQGNDLAAEGKALFERQFAPGRMPEGGDGLGPVFNHQSCVACHSLGGTGGAGSIDVNAVTLTADLTDGGRVPLRKALVAVLKDIHPGFVADGRTITPSILLHRFGTDADYERMHKQLGGVEVPREPTSRQREQMQGQLARVPQTSVKWPRLITLRLSQRNAPALFGAGAIDQIPDSALEQLAAAQERQGVVSGRVAPIGLAKAGRFGWRGQTERLHDFVLGACSNELGLEVPGSPQPVDPLRPAYRPAGLDLSAAQCASMTSFVASLPPPKFQVPTEPGRREIALRGWMVFDSVGCTACHVERIGSVEGLYSDLLLHDMGTALGDPVPADATFVAHSVKPLPPGFKEPPAGQSENQPLVPRGYYGGSSLASLLGSASPTLVATNPKTGLRTEFQLVATNVELEWRTPPLWGVADSAPYLHDGRAATLVEAIALHGGEADAIARKFFELPVADRAAVLEFLGSLRAP